LSSPEPKPEPGSEKAVSEAEIPPPPPDEQEPAPETVWEEDYDELVEPEEPVKQKKKKKGHWGGIIVAIIVILILVVWTIMSPKILPAQGETYIGSPAYASLGDFTGYRDIWAGNTSWGVSISGAANGTVNQPMQFMVLLTKISEKPGNWFLRGTSMDLRNVSIHLMDGTFLGAMTNQTDLGFGISATVPVTFTSPGSFELYIHAKFLVLEVMRIGFIPLEMVNIPEADFDITIDIV
jgi:hypothetical protein